MSQNNLCLRELFCPICNTRCDCIDNGNHVTTQERCNILNNYFVKKKSNVKINDFVCKKHFSEISNRTKSQGINICIYI